MITFLSLVTSVKDYVEVVHKLIESDSSFKTTNYYELGPIITYIVITFQEFIKNVFTLKWLNSLWDLPIIVPDISSAMISEISILDNYFPNAFNFLDKPLSYGETNLFFYNLEKFSIGLINSLFLFIPTGTTHLITIRRFVMQGLEAGYIAGLGSIAGNILWITSIIFGFRFFVIPWLSLDIFRYVLGFVLLVKYMWDSYNERKMAITTQPAKQKIFLLSFLLALTEQTSIYPFLTNLSIGSESSILESFPAQDLSSFVTIHFSYILGLTLGSLSLLHLTCWFWENPAFKIYMWLISSFKVSTSFYYKVLNFTFLYLTMICAISSIPYYGLDYTLTNPLGLVHDDRILYQSETLANAPQLSFLGTKASDRNTRRNRGRHGRRERWKRRIRKYRTFDASLYDQGVYDLFTIEDLNYGFDRFWLRRKMRNHRVRFRFFPGPWMRSFKKQLAKPRLESYAGPRQEFFRILFEQVYHPSFHVYSNSKSKNNKAILKNPNLGLGPVTNLGSNLSFTSGVYPNDLLQLGQNSNSKVQEGQYIKENLKVENSTLRKFVRKIDTRLKLSEIQSNLDNPSQRSLNKEGINQESIYSKRWKHIFSKISHTQKRFGDKVLLTNNKALLNNLYDNSLSSNKNGVSSTNLLGNSFTDSIKKQNSQIFLNLSSSYGQQQSINKDQQILKYRTLYLNPNNSNSIKSNSFNLNYKGGKTNQVNEINATSPSAEHSNVASGITTTPFTLFHPLKLYQKQQQAFEKKLHYYTPTVFRKFSIENNAPYFRVMMKRYFYYYKPTLRWERTMKVASLRKARRKTSSNPRKIQFAGGFTTRRDSGVETITQSGGVAVETNNLNIEMSNPNNGLTESEKISFNNFSRKTIPTHNYTIVGKRASRYRYQIYKDVLQHWYYTPFNRLLLKFDIDLFINRQPNTHFITKNEENLLHLRRFLLSEHYNTLRWYTEMEHYRSMKTKIGGTKSFVSGVYNQQFSGTFKKIRHLFAITPSQSEPVLKFDQPLYNEYFNNSTNNVQQNLIIHEELLTMQRPSAERSDSDDTLNVNATSERSALGRLPVSLDSTLQKTNTESRRNDLNNNNLPKDLVNESTLILRNYLKESNPIKQEYIKKLLEEKNYVELTQFLYKGRKIRGLKPVTNTSDFINQEKDYLLTSNELKELKELDTLKFDMYVRSTFPTDLWVNLLKKWKRKINDQEFLKNYLQRRVEKREKRKIKKEKTIKTKLDRLENIGFLTNLTNNTPSERGTFGQETAAGALGENQIPTGVQKTLNDGLLTLNKYKTNKTSLDDLKREYLLKQEKELSTSLNQLSRILKKAQDSNTTKATKNQLKSQLNRISKQVFVATPNRLMTFYQKYQSKTNKILKNRVLKIFTKSKTRKDNFKAWQEKERTLNKQKRMRKEFKPLSKNQIKYDTNNYSKYLDQNSDIVLSRGSRFLSENTQMGSTAIKQSAPGFVLGPSALRSGVALTKSADSIFETLKKADNSLELNPARKKVDDSTISISKTNKLDNNTSFNWNGIIKNAYSKYFRKKFKRKKSPQRRVRARKNRAVIKKRTLNDSLKREFKNLRRYNQSVELSKADLAGVSSTGSIFDLSSTSQVFKPSTLQRRAKQKKQRFWKQKRVKYAQKLRKYKKRRRSVLGKIRILNKQLKRIKATNDLKVWWWKSFLPNLRATTDSLWQFEKDRQIQKKLLELSIPEILERDKLNTTAVDSLQIGDFDYKPLAMPEALRLRKRSELIEQNSTDSTILNTSTNSIFEKFNSGEKTAWYNTNATNLSLDYNNNPNQNNNTTVNNINSQKETDTLSRIAENYLLSNKKEMTTGLQNNTVLTSPIPFYAGWDESLRKFVVTNRLLSRRESGYEMNLHPLTRDRLFESEYSSNIQNQKTINSISNLNATSERGALGQPYFDSANFEFTAAPLKGMNTATTLYWQIPFTTYDPDQFFALGMDGFAPLGWRRFQFRHTILKSWLYEKTTSNVNTQSISTGSVFGELRSQNTNTKGLINNTYIVKNKLNIVDSQVSNQLRNSINTSTMPFDLKTNQVQGLDTFSSSKNTNIKVSTSNLITKLNERQSPINSFMDKNSRTNLGDKNTRNIYRRLKKRYRRVKKHPRSPVWFPSGPLLNQVLPVHYIYIFYKRSRLPRDRYIKRRLVKSKVQTNSLANSLANSDSFKVNAISDFTLRKRVKTKRKYHIKQDITKQTMQARSADRTNGFAIGLIPRRVKFIGQDSEVLRWRPLSRQKLTKPIADLIKEKRLLRSKQRKKEMQDLNSKQPTNIRIKQLRRRVQRQIIRSVWRYKPHAGGFVWPGDYLKLESVKAPKLNIKSTNSQNLSDSKDLTLTRSTDVALRSTPLKVKRKKKRTIQEWQIQPKKYLLQKHNYNVIKKKLAKAQRSNKIQEKLHALRDVV